MPSDRPEKIFTQWRDVIQTGVGGDAWELLSLRKRQLNMQQGIASRRWPHRRPSLTRWITALFLAASLVAQSNGVEPRADLMSGLIAHWKADGDANDAVGALHGKMWMAEFAPGEQGQAFDFAAPSRTAVIIGEPALNENYPALTIAAWVNARSHGRSLHKDKGRTVISRTEDGGFALRVKEGIIELDLHTEAEDRSTQWLLFPGAKVPLHTWVLIVATYDGQAARAYLDGTALPRSLPVTGNIKKTTLPSARLMIGNEPGTNPLNVHQQTDPEGIGWHGRLDDIRVYNRALSAAEVMALYELTKPAVAYTPPPTPPPRHPPPPRPPPTTKEWLRSLVSSAAAGRNLDPLFYFLCVWFVALLIGKGAWRSFLGTGVILAIVWMMSRLMGWSFMFNWGAPITMKAHGMMLAMGYGVWLAVSGVWRRQHGGVTVDQRASKPRAKGRLWQMLWGGIIACLIVSIVVVLSDISFIGMGPFGLTLFAIVGLPHVAFVGAIGGAVAHDCLAPNTPAVLELITAISMVLALLCVGLITLFAEA